MAAANPQAHMTRNPFREKPDENRSNIEKLLRSLINVGNQPKFLQLYLLDQALQFFRTLPQARGDKVDAVITALRNNYCNPNFREFH